MSIYKRNETWWVRFTDPSGRRIRESTGTSDKQTAQEYHDKRKAECWRSAKLKEDPKTRYTWQQAVVKWLTEQKQKRSLQTDKSRLKWLHQHLANKYLDEIDKQTVDFIKQAKTQEGASNATVNRTLALVRAILKRAKDEWEWVDKIPTVRLYPEPKGIIRWLSHSERDRLLKELPEHLKDMVTFTLETGLRESNVTSLQWDQIDMRSKRAWIHPEQFKTGKALHVPLSEAACAVIRQQIGKNNVFVFTYNGERVTRANNHAWRKALIRAGIKDFRWHDLRHTWASWHVQNGTPLHVLKELGGWSDLTMVLKYSHLSGEHLREYVDKHKTK